MKAKENMPFGRTKRAFTIVEVVVVIAIIAILAAILVPVFANVNSYKYNVVYKSSNGTNLGSTSVTKSFGTTNTISPKTFSGYNTPSSQSVKWDSTSAKTITFTYTPTSVAATQSVTSGTWNSWTGQVKSTITYKTSIEWRNRTASSVQMRVVWENTLDRGYYGYAQAFYWAVGGVDVKTETIASNTEWKSQSSVARSVKKVTDWVTVPISTTNQTSVPINGTFWDAKVSKTWSGSFTIPAY